MTDININPFGQNATMVAGYPIADNLNTNSAQQALSAKQGVELKERIDNIFGGLGYNIIGRGFVDFGTMPSCLSSDPNNFLPNSISADGTNASVKYSDVIAKYDALVSAYPTYVSKQLMGNDASGTIPIYCYTFTPKYYIQHIYLQAGVHGWEPEAVFALAEIMYLISNAYGGNLSPKVENNDALRYLRGSVKITVVPCVNPWGFNNRGNCEIDKRDIAQNNYNNKQLNAEWDSNQAESVHIRALLDSIASSLSFAIDMHTTVRPDTRFRYGCFYGAIPNGSPNTRTMFRTWEWLYRFYDAKYPFIVNGDSVPNMLDDTYASVGVTNSGSFRGWFFSRYGKPACTIEFSDHTWTEDESYYDPTHQRQGDKPGWVQPVNPLPADANGNGIPLHTSTALSVAVNMYLNHILQMVYDGFTVDLSTDVPQSDKHPARG